MAQVQTVMGPVESDQLGTTLMHEHIILVNPEIEANYPGGFDEAAEVARAQDRLRHLKASGVDTVVDLTVIGLGRDVARIRHIVEPTGLNVIVATGVYTFDELPFYFKNHGPGTINGGPDILDHSFTTDIVDGIADTGIRAGILKCVTDRKGLTPDIERLLRANARVHRATGVPISTHTDAATKRGLDQQLVFRQEGVDLSRVIIGHSGDSTDISYLSALMDAGSYIGMDRFGLETVLGNNERIQTVATLAGLGYARQMVLSHDTSCFSQNYDADKREAFLPDWTHDNLIEVVVPRLRQAGVSDADLHQMLVANPADIFSRNDPY
jgi:phosphotriesterase-related protein